MFGILARIGSVDLPFQGKLHSLSSDKGFWEVWCDRTWEDFSCHSSAWTCRNLTITYYLSINGHFMTHADESWTTICWQLLTGIGWGEDCRRFHSYIWRQKPWLPGFLWNFPLKLHQWLFNAFATNDWSRLDIDQYGHFQKWGYP